MYNTEISVSGAMLDASQVEREMQSPGLPAAVGNAVAEVLIHHFEELNSERHSHGAFGFYEGAARSTGYTTEFGYPAVVVMQIGVAQRRFGGTILPKNGKYLAIPNSFSDTISATYGHSPTEFSNLVVVFGRQKATGNIGPIGLKASENENEDEDERVFRQKHTKDALTGEWLPVGKQGKEVKGAEGEILFWLCKSVYQDADESVLPPQEELNKVGRDAAVLWFSRRKAQTMPVNERIQP